MFRPFALLLCLLAIGGHAFADSTPHWVEVRSPHFVVLTDSNEKDARKLAGQFERMRTLFHTVLPTGGGDAGLPITVLAFKDRKGFQSVIPAAYQQKGALQLAGYFLRTPDRNYILLRLDTEGEHPYSTVYHEYTHFVLRKAEWLPLWLNEGLAEFYQNTDIDAKRASFGQPSADDILYLRQTRLLPLTTLFSVDHDSPYYHEEQKGSVFYAESWALTHYLQISDSDNKTHRINDYARFLASGENSVTAAQHAFGDLNRLQKDLEAYISHGDYKLYNLPITFTVDEASFQTRPISLDEANAVRADLLADNDRKAEARALLEEILRNDPKNTLAHETMGSLAYRDHDLAAARKWYSEATQLDSQSYLAYYYSGTLPMMQGDRNDPAIEPSLRRCIKLEPTFAPAYDALANYFMSQHKNLDEAHLLTVQAVQLEPEDLNYRLNAAAVLVEQKNIDSALHVLQAAADHVAKTTEQVARVEMQISQLKQYQAALARSEASTAALSSTTASATGGSFTSTAVPGSNPRAHVIHRDDDDRVYPAASPSAPHHTVHGVLHNVRCSYPTVLTFELDQSGKTIPLFTPNYFKVNFSTANYVPSGDLDPCKAIEGMKASVEYAEVTDKNLTGQVLSIELSR
jgi:Tfp pilus assembly protein PilF